MTKKKATAGKKVKAPSAKKKTRSVGHKLIHRDRKDLQLKDYLMEEHPELGLPLDGAKPERTRSGSRAKKSNAETKS